MMDANSEQVFYQPSCIWTNILFSAWPPAPLASPPSGYPSLTDNCAGYLCACVWPQCGLRFRIKVMRIRNFHGTLICELCLVIVLAGCARNAPQFSPPLPLQWQANVADRQPLVSKNLYVANHGDSGLPRGSVTVYAPGTEKPLRTITDGISVPRELKFDSSGNLYVANTNTVTVYAPGEKTPLRTYSKGLGSSRGVHWFVIGSSGDAYIGTGNSVRVYKAETTELIQTIINGIANPGYMIFDHSGRLYVANAGATSGGPFTITVYSKGKHDLIRTLKTGSNIHGLAVDGWDNLYVATFGSASEDEVTVYPAGGSKPLRTIRPVKEAWPVSLVLDGSANLYVGWWGLHSTVSAYAPGKSKPFLTISKGIIAPWSMKFGSFHYLNVANTSTPSYPYPGSVTEYAPGSGKLVRTITKGIAAPVSVAFGP